jgi:hypothetical protein
MTVQKELNTVFNYFKEYQYILNFSVTFGKKEACVLEMPINGDYEIVKN